MQQYINITDYYSGIVIRGADAETFLQGQLTCDVRELSDVQALPTACCDHKGRMVASGMLWRVGEVFYIWLPRAMRAVLLAHLQKYAVFSNVVVEDDGGASVGIVSDEVIGGLAVGNGLKLGVIDDVDLGLNADSDQMASLIMVRLPSLVSGGVGDQYIVYGDLDVAGVSDGDRSSSYIIWSAACVRHGLVFVEPEVQGKLIPQMVHWEALGGVSFTKGCFVGQEVVARTQHLGKLKRRLYRGCVDFDDSDGVVVKLGAEIMDTSRKVLGFVVASAGGELLMVLRDEAVEGEVLVGELVLGSVVRVLSDSVGVN